MAQQMQTEHKIIKVTVTTTYKIEVISAEDKKATACNCCTNCKR